MKKKSTGLEFQVPPETEIEARVRQRSIRQLARGGKYTELIEFNQSVNGVWWMEQNEN